MRSSDGDPSSPLPAVRGEGQGEGRGVRGDADRRTETVRRFYAQAPFPNYAPADTLATLRARAARSDFARLLDQAIAPDARVLDLGCGTGQMALFLAGGERRVVGADLTRASLAL